MVNIEKYLGKLQSKRSKYGNKKTEYNGRIYDSTKEANYAMSLDWRKKSGEIKNWMPQLKYSIEVNNIHICDYYLDFWVQYPGDRIEYIDIKGGNATRTAVFEIKKKLVEAIYKIKIQCI